jgi:hypothetical protein
MFSSSEMLHPVDWSVIPTVTVYLPTRYVAREDCKRKQHRCKDLKHRKLNDSLNQQKLTVLFQIMRHFKTIKTYFKTGTYLVLQEQLMAIGELKIMKK